MPDGFQRLLGLAMSILTLPLAAALMLAVRADTPGPVLYRAARVGEGGRTFTCFKLRTMRWQPEAPGVGLTGGRDPRVTKVGRLLRAVRLDELPQLWNVARGEMRFVGPRPEDPRYVDFQNPLHREVFTARPGITGLTQLLFADEAKLLDGPDRERKYIDEVLPAKLRVDAAYLRHRSLPLDLWVLARTPLAVLGRQLTLPKPLRDELADAGLPGSQAGLPGSYDGRPASQPGDSR